jgi:hypothetical protein
MTSTNRLVKKLTLLFVLAASLAYLRKPEPAIAITCQQQCENQLQICSSQCNPTNKWCERACVIQYEACLKNCP